MENRGSAQLVILAATLILSTVIRLLPYLANSTFFSTDIWGVVRNTNILVEHSPISLNSSLFDGYNNYWPTTAIELSVLSTLLGASVFHAIEIAVSAITLSLTTVLFSLKKGWSGVLAALVAGSAFNIVLMTGAYTKEGCAYTMLMIILYTFLKPGRVHPLIMVIPAIALPFTHHLTTLVATVILYSIIVAWVISFFHQLEFFRIDPARAIYIPVPLLLSQLAQYLLLGKYSTLAVATQWLALSLTSYVTVFSVIGIAISLVTVRLKAPVLRFFTLVFLASAVAISTIGSLYIYMLDYQTLTAILLIVTPTLLVIAGNVYSREETAVTSIIWMTAISGLAIFFIGEEVPGYESIVYRVAGFIILIASIGFAERSKWFQRVSAAVFLATSITVYALTMSGLTPTLGWYWNYRESEVYTGRFLSEKAVGLTVCSDVKQSMMLSGLYKYDATNLPSCSRSPMLIYGYMWDKGALVSVGRTVKIWFQEVGGIIFSNGDGFLII
uniref:Glycosyltransferase RgtA/B/C/D-like domain-containing protein n=1 Tax=Thermogladius calderae TaxID=1200300 RepID=A0A7J3XWW6_9CREN